MIDLKNKNIIVTGASGGIGNSIVQNLYEKGANILASGTNDKKLIATDSSNGKELWSYELPFIGSSPPITYEVDNEQFILINSTGSFSLKKGYPELVEFGNLIMVFKLKNENKVLETKLFHSFDLNCLK